MNQGIFEVGDLFGCIYDFNGFTCDNFLYDLQWKKVACMYVYNALF